MPRWNMKNVVARAAVLIGLLGMVAAGFYLAGRIPEPSTNFALAPVRRGDLVIKTYLRGELRAARSISLTAPNLGSITTVTALAPNGSLASVGDLIFEMDDSERRAALEDAELEVARVGQLLKQAETDLEIHKSQDAVELLKSRFAVKKAELEVQKNELISAIDARKNVLTLEESKRREQKLEQDIQSRLQQREAELAVLREQLRKARLDADRERRRIDQSRVLSPMPGLVFIQPNRAGGRGGFGQTTPDVQEGDQVPPGMEVVRILDLSEVELVAKVEEVERSNLREGQEAVVLLDALPRRLVRAKVRRLGNTASANVFLGESTKKFDCILSIDMEQLLGHVGATPEQIRRIMTTARRAPASATPDQRPPPDSDALSASDETQTRTDSRGPGESRGRREGIPSDAGQGRPGVAGFSDEQREQFRQRFQQMLGGRDFESMSQEERQKLFQQMRPPFGGSGASGRGGQSSGNRGGFGPGAGGFGFTRPAGVSSPGGGSAPQTPLSLSLSKPSGQVFTAEQRRAATLPSALKPDSDLDVLLRPGLLADAEVIVDRVENTLYVPYQSVFALDGQSIVYLWNGSGLAPRPVQLGKRSESQIAVLGGLAEGDLIALEPPDPGDRRTRRDKEAKRKTARPSFPGGAAGGRGGTR